MATQQQPGAVLIAETPGAAAEPAQLLSGTDLSVQTVGLSAAELLDPPGADTPACLVVAASRADGEWRDVVERVRAVDPELPVVLVTSDGSEELAAAGIDCGVDGYVAPSTGRELVETVESAVASYRATCAERERDRQYRLLAEYAGDPMCILDGDGTVLLCNQALGELLGRSVEAVVGTSVSEFVPAADIERAQKLLTDLQESDRRYGMIESRVQPEQGEAVPCEVSIAPVVETGEKYPQSAVVLRDVTERKEKQRQLAAKNDRLETFVSVISHDLRNPLQIAESRLDVLTEDTETRYHAELGDALDRMETIIEELLAIARQGLSVEDTDPVSVRAVAHDAWDLVATGEATLNVEIDREIEADRSRLQQLFENLFRNAVEHTDSSPTVRVGPIKPIQTMTRAGDVVPNGFYVADDGPGIPPDQREEIFEYGETTSDTGTGFGLAIVKDVVTGHDWQIHVTESATGGARFEIQGVDVLDE